MRNGSRILVATLVCLTAAMTATLGIASDSQIAGKKSGQFSAPVEAPQPDQKANSESTGPVGANAVNSEIRSWIEKLADSDFPTRKAARAHLIAAGEASVLPVVQAADTDDPELAMRCLDILDRLHQSPDESTRSAAEEALRKLTESSRRPVAQKAGTILKKSETPDENVIGVAGFGGGGNVQVQIQVQGGGGNIQIRGGQKIQIGGAGGNGAVQQQIHQEVNVHENGRQIHIRNATGKGIQIRVTETTDGEKRTQEYKAADLDELKEKHPEAAKIYEKYLPAQNNVIQIRAGGVGKPLRIRDIAPQDRESLPEKSGKEGDRPDAKDRPEKSEPTDPNRDPGTKIDPNRAGDRDEPSPKTVRDGHRQLEDVVRRLEELTQQQPVDPVALQELIQEMRRIQRSLPAAEIKD